MTINDTSMLPKIPVSAEGVQNPANPTGSNMTLNIDYPNKVDTLTGQLVNTISNQSGLDISGNSQLKDISNNTIGSTGVMPLNETKPITYNQQPTNNNSAGTKPIQPPKNITSTVQGTTSTTTPPVTTSTNNTLITTVSTTTSLLPLNSTTTTSNLTSLNNGIQQPILLDTQLVFKP
jgi:hypothetical protein